MSGDPSPRLQTLRVGIAALAERLYLLDTEPQVELLDDPSAYHGRTAEVVARARGGVPGLWARYSLLRDRADDIGRSIDANDWDTATSLLDVPSIELPDGTVAAPGSLLAELTATADDITTVASRLSGAWMDVIPRVDRARSALARLEERAGQNDIDDEVLRSARSRLLTINGELTGDPLGVDITGLEQTIATAQTAIDTRAAERDGLRDALAEAWVTLDELRRLIPAGSTALAETRDRILRPRGLLTPLSRDVVDGGPRSLGPWLERLVALDTAGAWERAAAGLAQWRLQADTHLGNARRVHAANTGPLRRRGELRGLLDALRAKAAATGHAEHPPLTAAHTAARELLYVAPCPVDLAATRVREYQTMLEGINMVTGP